MQLKQEIAELKKSVESASKSKRKSDNNDASTPPAKKRKEKQSFVSMVLDKEKHVEFPQNSHVVTNSPKSGSNLPNLPHKTTGAPKNALQAYYSQRRAIQITNECFSTISDSGPPHDLRWTSTFTDPLNG